MIDPFEYPDEVLWELSSPDLDREGEDYAEFIESEDSIIENRKPITFPKEQYKSRRAPIKLASKSCSPIHTQSYIPPKDEPTDCTASWWLYAESRRKYKKATKNSGKWCIFIEPKFIDAAWEQVSDATQQGLLGGRTKCSTKKGWKGKGNDYVIIVYTYDYKDTTDVMRIREELRELGFTKPIPYKTDADTKAKKYAGCGQKIAKYYQ